MTINKANLKVEELRVWCDSCSIRIAPNEEQIAVADKTYHQRCYAKTKPSQAIHIRGHKK
jgi:hypothetical protein